MTGLTVPRAPTRGGRAASPTVQGTRVGEVIAQFGTTMSRVGNELENDRLARQRQRLQVDLTRDMNELRREVMQIGDPDELDRRWSAGQQALKTRYMEPDPQTGAFRVDPKNVEQFDLMFDQLSNGVGHQVGLQALQMRNDQREATYTAYAAEALSQAPAADPVQLDLLREQGLEQIEMLEASGIIDANEAQQRKLKIAGDLVNARAIELVATDPGAFLEQADAGVFDDLGGMALTRLKLQAKGELERRTADQAKAQDRYIGQQLKAYIETAPTGRLTYDADFLADPAVQAHPSYPEAAAAIELANEQPDLLKLPPSELDQLIAREKAGGISQKWQNERLDVLERVRETAKAELAADPVAYRRRIGFSVAALPEFDATQPQTYVAAVQARLVEARSFAEDGFTSELRLFTNEERAAIREAANVSQSPDSRAALAASLAAGVGDPALVGQLADDRVFGHMGALIAAGGPPSIAAEAFRGQAAMAENNISLPPAADRAGATFEQIGALFAEVPGGETYQASLVAAADAIYAARARLVEPDKALDEDLYRQALHEAAGGTGRFSGSEAAGGILEVRGMLTPLPAGVRPSSVETSLERLGLTEGRALNGRQTMQFSDDVFQEQLASVGAGLPGINGAPLTSDDLDAVYLRAVGNDAFVLVYDGRGSDFVIKQEDNPTQDFVFSLRALIKEVQP